VQLAAAAGDGFQELCYICKERHVVQQHELLRLDTTNNFSSGCNYIIKAVDADAMAQNNCSVDKV
jgi:hypothetical protein